MTTYTVPESSDWIDSGKPTKVVFVQPWGNRSGGAENVLWTFLGSVDQSRLRPIVVFLQPGSFAQEVAATGIHTIVLRAGRLRQLLNTANVIITIARLLRSQRPDLIVSWSAKMHLYTAPAATIVGQRKRLMWWQHGTPNRHWLDRVATMLPSRAVGCCSLDSAKAQESLSPARPTFVVHPGIESPRRRSRAELTALRQALRIPKGRAVVGIVGRLQPWKGQDRLLRAIAFLRSRGHDVHALVVGGDAFSLSPQFQRFLHELARELRIEEAVAFTGQVPDPTPYMQLMDVFVNASDREPFGIVLLEAMALGVPPVAFAVGGPVEIIQTEVSGLLVESIDHLTLAQAIERLLSDAPLRARLAQGARIRYQQAFDASRMTKELGARLQQVALPLG